MTSEQTVRGGAAGNAPPREAAVCSTCQQVQQVARGGKIKALSRSLDDEAEESAAVRTESGGEI